MTRDEETREREQAQREQQAAAWMQDGGAEQFGHVLVMAKSDEAAETAPARHALQAWL